MQETGNENLFWHKIVFYIWSWTVFPANRRMNLGLFTMDLHRMAQEGHLSNLAKNEIREGNCILSACDSVYRENFVSPRETVRLN